MTDDRSVYKEMIVLVQNAKELETVSFEILIFIKDDSRISIDISKSY